MGHWGIKSYEHDEAAEALDAGFERVHGRQYEELMDDRNPLSFEQVQKKLADSRTLDAAIDALCEMLGAEACRNLGRARAIGVGGNRSPPRRAWRDLPELWRPWPSTGCGTKRLTGKKRRSENYAGARRSTYWSERQGRILRHRTSDDALGITGQQRTTDSHQRTTSRFDNPPARELLILVCR